MHYPTYDIFGFCVVLAGLVLPVASEQLLKSDSLNVCQQDSGFTASRFNVVFTPSNNSINVDVDAISSVQGTVLFDVEASAYGYNIITMTLDPCDMNLNGLCPMQAGKIVINFSQVIKADALSQIPGIAYTIPDLDATVRVKIKMVNVTNPHDIACVEADISNGKTVDLVGVKWATAVIAGLTLLSSAIVNGLGHLNTAAHVAANTLSLVSYFQAQAIVGLAAVPLPPIVQSWTQDFQWSMGIIRVGFMQDIFTWYQRATGGTPSTIFDSLTTKSVQVEKRSTKLFSFGLNSLARGLSAVAGQLSKRANITTSAGTYVVYGIQRVAFRAYIESTNLFLTGLVFFSLFCILAVIVVAAFKFGCELAVKRRWMGSHKFMEFRSSWSLVLKGIILRLLLVGFPPMCILSLWEFTQVDSPAEVVLAVAFLASIICALAWGASKVIRIARYSVSIHRNPAYILFSDPAVLNKWGFLYMQFRATAYYFIVPILAHTLVKAMFIAFGQKQGGVAQAIGFVVIEALALIAATVMRPWMDKSTNSFNIAIQVVNFLNAVALLIFTNVFGTPRLVIGVVGVVFFILNAAFSTILLLMLIISTIMVFFRGNPDARYQFMSDDRASFMKSQTHLDTTRELDDLAATARGDKSGYASSTNLEPSDTSTDNHARHGGTSPDASRHLLSPSLPLFPADQRSMP